ncbi:MAG TPA: hypothetical protein VNL77_16340 [Roseiflexaceae bacterium]|nr:hypothetical protein [Roseiflexaceae bacterium]
MDRYIDLRFLDYLIRDLGTLWWMYLLQGLLLIAWGIAILIWPELLTALVAALFVIAGIVVLAIGWRVWQLRRRYGMLKRQIIGI